MRIYHKFGSGEVLKELLGMEADYDTIKSVSLPCFSPAQGRVVKYRGTDE